MVNLVVEAGLTDAISVEILELVETQGGPEYEVRVTLTRSREIAALVTALDVDLVLGPPARCIERYRVRFRLADGRVEEFAYSCEDGQAFLGGTQAFWMYQQVAPPTAFQELMREMAGP